MIHSCVGSNKKTGKSCSRKVAVDGGYCYQHGPTKQVDIPEDISQVVGRKPVVIDDIDEDGNQIIPAKEVFESILVPSKNTTIHSTDITHHDGNANTSYLLPDNIEYLKPNLNEVEDDIMEKDYSILWKRIKNFFKRSKK